MKSIKRLQIGKKGLNKEFILQVKNIFKNGKIVKISLLKSACRDMEKAEEIGEELVNNLGKNYIYKRVGYVLTVKKFRKDIRK
jgi:RNA-binding protein YhbY